MNHWQVKPNQSLTSNAVLARHLQILRYSRTPSYHAIWTYTHLRPPGLRSLTRFRPPTLYSDHLGFTCTRSRTGSIVRSTEDGQVLANTFDKKLIARTWKKPSGQALPGPPPGQPRGTSGGSNRSTSCFPTALGVAKPTAASEAMRASWKRMLLYVAEAGWLTRNAA